MLINILLQCSQLPCVNADILVFIKANTLMFVVLYDQQSTCILHILVTTLVTYSLTTVCLFLQANPGMVKNMEKEKAMLFNQLRDLEWRLDQESKVRTGTQYLKSAIHCKTKTIVFI